MLLSAELERFQGPLPRAWNSVRRATSTGAGSGSHRLRARVFSFNSETPISDDAGKGIRPRAGDVPSPPAHHASPARHFHSGRKRSCRREFPRFADSETRSGDRSPAKPSDRRRRILSNSIRDSSWNPASVHCKSICAHLLLKHPSGGGFAAVLWAPVSHRKLGLWLGCPMCGSAPKHQPLCEKYRVRPRLLSVVTSTLRFQETKGGKGASLLHRASSLSDPKARTPKSRQTKQHAITSGRCMSYKVAGPWFRLPLWRFRRGYSLNQFEETRINFVKFIDAVVQLDNPTVNLPIDQSYLP